VNGGKGRVGGVASAVGGRGVEGVNEEGRGRSGGEKMGEE